MRQLRQMLRLARDGVSVREIAQVLGVARSTVHENLGRAAKAGLAWPLAGELTDEVLGSPTRRGISHRTSDRTAGLEEGMALTDWFGSRKVTFAEMQDRVREEVRERLPGPKPVGFKRIEEIMGSRWLPDMSELDNEGDGLASIREGSECAGRRPMGRQPARARPLR